MELAWPAINLKFSIPKCYNIQINTIRQSITQLLFHIKWYIWQGDMFRPSRSSSGPLQRSHNADKLNNFWVCFLGGPEDDRLGRNMSPCHIYHFIWNKCCVFDCRIYLYLRLCFVCHWLHYMRLWYRPLCDCGGSVDGLSMKFHIVIYSLMWILLWMDRKTNSFQLRCFGLEFEFSDDCGGQTETCRNMGCVRILELLSAWQSLEICRQRTLR